MTNYKISICEITDEPCDEEYSCEKCIVAHKHEEFIKTSELDAIIIFDKTSNLNGIPLTVNRSNTLAKITEDTINELNETGDIIPTTIKSYCPEMVKTYPAIMLLKRYLNLGIPYKILANEDRLGVFFFKKGIYLCAPRIKVVD